MIATRTDVHLGPEGGRRVSVGSDAPPGPSIRFADLLSAGQAAGVHPGVAVGKAGSSGASPVVSLAVPTELNPAPPTAKARVFNQYGFFASQTVVVPASSLAVAIDQPDSIAVAMRDAGQADSAPSLFPEGHDARLLATGPASLPTQAVAIRALRPGGARPLPLILAGMPQARTARTDALTPVGGVDRPRPTTPRRAISPGASVAVALHAGATGVDVAALVAGLNERERTRLADEIAAMLSMHGYAPAQITITAVAARAARQEHR